MYSLVQSFRLGFQAVFIIFTFQCVLLLFLFLPDEAMSYFQALEVRCVYFKKWPLFITVRARRQQRRQNFLGWQFLSIHRCVVDL